MAEPLKNHYNTTYFSGLCKDFISVYPDFPKETFLTSVFDEAWPARELKQRMQHITQCLHHILPGDYRQHIALLKQVAPLTGKNSKHSGFLDIFFPDYVEKYGLDDWHISMDALECFTQFSTSELAIRPFIIQNPVRTMQKLTEWSKHSNKHVRRLASEGCRPRLPWACALPVFKEDPSLIMPILENLKTDPSTYVRKSVANNLNDISKDHPQMILDLARDWYGYHEKTDHLIKHACRTLLKSGNQAALAIFGLQQTDAITLDQFSIAHATLKKGCKNFFTWQFHIKEPCKIRFEYRIEFARPHHKTSQKIFKISEKNYKEGTHSLSRHHNFSDLSTRKLHPGTHRITLLANGIALASEQFVLHSS